MDPDPRLPLIGPVAAPAFQVMGWNIRRRLSPVTPRPADRWDRRAPRMRALLQVEQPTVLGAQEALPDQVSFLQDSLGQGYRVIGQGRSANGGGEASPILYDSRRLELLDWKQSALSDTPERPGSVSWGNIIPRIMVSAIFRDRVTSRRFLTVNTHLDHLSRRSRVRSAQAVLRVVSDSGLSAVVTGDLNDGAGSAPLRELLTEGELVDTWETAEAHDSEAWGTFPNYRAPRRGGRRLDWILASPTFRVLRAATNPQRHDGGWASDHLPVQAVMLPPENSGAQ
ncbi:endonuclease/exonuclease/phosphatase family protein [Corynebacterium halotolerans]